MKSANLGGSEKCKHDCIEFWKMLKILNFGVSPRFSDFEGCSDPKSKKNWVFLFLWLTDRILSLLSQKTLKPDKNSKSYGFSKIFESLKFQKTCSISLIFTVTSLKLIFLKSAGWGGSEKYNNGIFWIISNCHYFRGGTHNFRISQTDRI